MCTFMCCMVYSKFEAIPDNLTPEEILEQAQAAAKDAASNLSLRRPESKVLRSKF